MSTDLNLDIHNAPSAADVDVSSALSQPLPTEPTAARTEAMSLVNLQKQLDVDISRHMAVLTSNGVNMQTPLIDAQGFPLANKDLMAIRIARQRINVLRNDMKAVRDRVSKLLELAINGDTAPQPASRNKTNQDEQLKAFARVNSVAESSPAQTAGLQQGDQILRFGSVTAESPKGLGALATPGVVVDGTSIQLLVRREAVAQAVALTLLPRADWGGRGLLGCHLLPL
ncbi:related to 26S proteasome non-ATPase regulatory subunit 9 [Ustilago trichophora]|uniref:Probable 26S proteasome regulatory subunit p27 n=1 Tax=Ustilago trichophora TaxID=86804 RepID=A0A5C3E9L0_9BASI|nr:related to 26S proteasome non-ATPase regulatory subunit 9 [Ustilago trichophora]